MQQGVATFAQILDVIPRRAMQTKLARGELVKVWPGIYSLQQPDLRIRLRGLDLRTGHRVACCLGTAANLYGFDTEGCRDLHVLNPPESRLRSAGDLVVHRRDDAPLRVFKGRPVTTPAWTAVEVARGLARPRALATLDAALRTGLVSRAELLTAADGQQRRRGMAHVRQLIQLANGKAESPMESEARLVMHDGGLPDPVLQHWIIDLEGRAWRVDFAWPEAGLVVEYDGVEFHSSPEDFRRDRQKWAALQEMNWTVLPVIADDVRERPEIMLRRIRARLTSAHLRTAERAISAPPCT